MKISLIFIVSWCLLGLIGYIIMSLKEGHWITAPRFVLMNIILGPLTLYVSIVGGFEAPEFEFFVNENFIEKSKFLLSSVNSDDYYKKLGDHWILGEENIIEFKFSEDLDDHIRKAIKDGAEESFSNNFATIQSIEWIENVLKIVVV
jgi:hypothetical protein